MIFLRTPLPFYVSTLHPPPFIPKAIRPVESAPVLHDPSLFTYGYGDIQSFAPIHVSPQPFISFIQCHRYGICHHSPASPLFVGQAPGPRRAGITRLIGYTIDFFSIFSSLFISSFLEIMVFPNRVSAMSNIEGVAVLKTISITKFGTSYSCTPRPR
jgi:hypothetical protein